MGYSSGGFNSILRVLIGAFAIQYLHSFADGTSTAKYCQGDWELCLATGECVYSGCLEEIQKKSHKKYRDKNCGEGLVFCTAANACVNKCFSPSTKQSNSCPSDKPFCVMESKCLPDSECPKPPEEMTCGPGMVYCAAEERCVKGKCNVFATKQLTTSQCPKGTVLCMTTGKCTSLEACEGSTEQTPVVEIMHSCSKGEIFNIRRGKCVKYSMYPEWTNSRPGDEGFDRPEEGGREQNIDRITCSEGKIFNIRRGECVEYNMNPEWIPDSKPVDEGFDKPFGKPEEGNREQNIDRITCSDGKIFNIRQGKCVTYNMYPEWNPNSKPVDKEFDKPLNETEKGSTEPDIDRLSCSEGKVFCLSSGTCEAEGGCGARPPHTWSTMCPKNYVYCMGRQECVRQEVGCDKTSSTFLTCPRGKIFDIATENCVFSRDNGNFGFDGDMQTCPSKIKGTHTHTTCMSSEICPFGHSCCPDADTLHYQCLSKDGISVNTTLVASCKEVESDMDDTGLTCDQPSDCHSPSICCDGKCKTYGGVTNCPLNTLYCSFKKQCIKTGEKCKNVCATGKTICKDTGKCEKKNTCKGNEIASAPAMMPSLLYMDENSTLETNEGAIIGSVLQGSEVTATDKSIKSVSVEELGGTAGLWQVKMSSTDDWEDVKKGDTMMESNWIRFTPVNITCFGLAFINLTSFQTTSEIETSHVIVQLIAPKLPVLNMTRIAKWHSLLEDTPSVINLRSLVSLNMSDGLYWSCWRKSLSMPSIAAMMNLIDSAHATSVEWVGLLSKPHLKGKRDKSSKMNRGFAINVVSNKNVAKISFSTNQVKWRPIKDQLSIPISASEDLEILNGGGLKFEPFNNANGNITLEMEIFNGKNNKNDAINDNKSNTNSNKKSDKLKVSEDALKTRIFVEVLPFNDSPYELKTINSKQLDVNVLNFTDGKLNPETKWKPVNEIVSTFYNDPDNNKLGMVIIQAQSSDIGNWQYLAAGNIVDIRNLSSSPIKSDMVWSNDYQGVGDSTAMKRGISCSSKDNTKVGKSKCKATTNDKMRDKQQTVYTVSEDGDVEVTYASSVNALQLSPETKIRFKPTGKLFSKAQALNKTRLMFLASDMSDDDFGANAVSNKEVNINDCKECGNGGSLSITPALLVVEVYDCGGQPVLAEEPKMLDACGVCGGDNSSCKDCNGVVNGGAKKECGVCSSEVVEKDCANACNENVMIELNNKRVCVAKSEADLKLCDNTTDSGAILNKCKKCVGGTTGLTDKEGMDRCDVCGGTNECVGCDDEPFSKKVLDMCGRCLLEDDDDYNANCNALGEILPNYLDLAVIAAFRPGKSVKNMTLMEKQVLVKMMTLRADYTGISKDMICQTCELINVETDEVIKSTTSKCFGERARAEFKLFKKGKWNLQCKFAMKKTKSDGEKMTKTDEEMITLKSKATVTIVNSSESEINVINEENINNGNTSIVEISVGGGNDLSKAKCFLTNSEDTKKNTEGESLGPNKDVAKSEKEGMQKNKRKRTGRTFTELEVVSYNNSVISCKLPDGDPGRKKIGVALTPETIDKIKKNELDIATTDIQLKASIPKVMNATFDDDSRVLSITFSFNIEINVGKCEDIFEKNIFGDNLKCKNIANTLLVKIMDDTIDPLAEGNLIKFSNAKGIIQKNGDPETAPSAAGDVIVTKEENKRNITFVTQGDTTACNGTNVVIVVGRIRGVKFSNAELKLNFTWVPKAGNQQSDNIVMWENVREISEISSIERKKKMFEITIPGDYIFAGYTYLVVLYVADKSSDRISSTENLKLKQSEVASNYIVNIAGQPIIFPDRTYRYRAVLKTCGDTEDDVDKSKIKYYWSTSPEVIKLGNNNGVRNVKIKKGSVRGGSSYTLTVSATYISEEQTIVLAEGSMEITAASTKPKAILSASKLKIGTTSKIRIDASKSFDLDNPTKDLIFKWTCANADGGSCYGTKNGAPERFEAFMSEEDLSKPVLNVAEGFLPMGKYIFTVTTSNDKSSDSADVEVVIASGDLPIINIINDGSLDNIDISKQVYIKATVTGMKGTSVYWTAVNDDGYNFLDLSSISESASREEFTRRMRSRSMDLLIPPPEDPSNPYLQEGKYLFRLIATTASGFSSQSDVVIVTNAPPSDGTITVNTTEGEGLLTPFNVTISDWDDIPDDFPLRVELYYTYASSSEKEDEILVTKFADDSPSMVITLPARSGVDAVDLKARICDARDACATTDVATIQIDPPSKLPDGYIDTQLGIISELLKDDDRLPEAVYHASGILATLKTMKAGDTLDQTIADVEDIINIKLNSLKTRLSTDKTAETVVQPFLRSLFVLAEDAKLSLKSILNLANLHKHLMASQMNKPPPKDAETFEPGTSETSSESPSGNPIILPKSDKALDAARSGRRKRQIAPPLNEGTNPVVGRTINEAEDGIRMLEMEIDAQETQGEIAPLLDDMFDAAIDYMKGLCKETPETENPLAVTGKYIGFTVIKTKIEDRINELFSIVEDGAATSSLDWGPILNQYTSWSCGNVDVYNEPVPCYSACLGTIQLNKDKFPSVKVKPNPPGTPKGNFVGSLIMNPITGEAESPNRVPQSVLYDIVVPDFTTPENHTIICSGWAVDKWNGSMCSKAGQLTNNNINYQKCACSIPTITSAFVVYKPPKPPTTTAAPVLSTTPTGQTPIIDMGLGKKRVKFVIDANYTALVKGKEEEFKDAMQGQLASLLNTTKSSIIIVDISEGSIVVEFDILDQLTRTSNQPTAEASYEYLAELISTQGLVLKGLKNEDLIVKPQPLDGSGPPVIKKEEPTFLPIIIGAVVGGVLLLVLVGLCVVWRMKDQKRMDKVRPLQSSGSGSQNPTYRSIHFENSLDGTATSLAKNRKNNSLTGGFGSADGSYTDEGLYIERKSTAGSRDDSGNSSRGSSGFQSGDDYVPEAFHYRKPTREELESSKPIPPHIQEKLTKEKFETIPGTPEGL